MTLRISSSSAAVAAAWRWRACAGRRHTDFAKQLHVLVLVLAS
jgi:hypothetical protein